MSYMLWAGAVFSLAGVGVLIWCIVAVLRAKRQGLSDTDMRIRLRRLTAVNMAAVGLSGLGLMMVVVAIALG